MALISVVIPVYNAERFVEQSLASVQAQRLADWEIIAVIDTKSADRSRAICEEVAATDSRIKIYAGVTSGVVANREYGIRQAAAPYIAFLDADDWWHPEKLARQYAFMRERQTPLSCTAYYRMSYDGLTTRSLSRVPYAISYEDLLATNVFGTLTVMLDRRLCPECTFPKVVPGEDYGLWLKILRHRAPAYGLNEPLAYYREVPGSLSSKKWRSVLTRWRLLREEERLPLARAGYYLARGLWGAVNLRSSVDSSGPDVSTGIPAR